MPEKWGEGVAEGWETKAKQLGQSLRRWYLWNKVVLHSVGLYKACSILVEIMPLLVKGCQRHYAEVSESELRYNLTFSLCSGKLAAAQIHSTFSTLDQACKSCKNSSQSLDLHITKSGGNKWMFPRLSLLITRRPALLPSIFVSLICIEVPYFCAVSLIFGFAVLFSACFYPWACAFKQHCSSIWVR